MNEMTQTFIRRMKEDTEFRQKMAQQTSKEAMIEAAAEEGITLTSEDIDEINKTLKKETMDALDAEKASHQLVIKMMEEDAFAEKVMTQTETDDVIQVAKEAGMTLTEEDLQEANAILLALMGIRPGAAGKGELSEEDLEQVAGGTALTSISEITMSAALFTTMCVSVTVVTLASAVSAITYGIVKTNEG